MSRGALTQRGIGMFGSGIALKETFMRAIQVVRTGGPEVLDYVEVPRPKPKPGEVLVRIHAIGVGKPDALVRTGVYKWMPSLPAIPGIEATGHVVVLGAGVQGLQLGEPVFIYPWKTRGCYAEYVAVQASDVTPLPATIDLDDAATLSNFIIARTILHEVPRGRTLRKLYVNGAAGGVGSAIIQIASLEGIEVIAGTSSSAKCDFARMVGASHTVDYSNENVADRVLAFTNGRGVDLVCDQIVGPNFTDSIRMLANWGTIVSFNAMGGMPAQETFTAMRANLTKSPGIRCFTLHSYDEDPDGVRRLVEETVSLFAASRIQPAIFERIPLAAARRAHELLDARSILGKVILKP
jgi:NADPH:quinone reductase